jgi:uncharacterized protein YukE
MALPSSSEIRVQIAALQSAAGAISVAAETARLGEGRARAAGNAAGAFGGEPAGDAFSAACARGAGALGSIADALDQLSNNTSAAAHGYVVTDEGAMPSSFGLHGVFQERHRSP